MSCIEFTRIVENYTFTPPSFISERDYDLLKTKTNLSREVPLYRNAKIEHAHNNLTALILVSFLAVVLVIFGLVSSNETPAWAIILLVISIFGVLHPMVNSRVSNHQ